MPYRLLTSPEQLEREREAWEALESISPGHIFQTHSFLSVWLRTAGEATGARPLVVTYEVDGRVVGIFPASTVRYGPVRLTTWLGGPYVLDSGDVLFDANSADVSVDEFVAQSLKLLQAHTRTAPLYLTNVREDSLALPALSQTLRAHKLSAAPFVVTRGQDFDAYLMCRSKHLRRNLKRRRNSLTMIAPLEFTILKGDDSRAEKAARDILRLKHDRFGQSGPRSGAFSPGYAEFRVEQVLTEPHTRVALLTLGGEFLAGQILCEYRNRMNLLVAAFDPAHAKLSPGLLLDGQCIADCFERGFDVCDFGWGTESHKYRWTGDEVTLTTFVGRGVAGRALSLAARLRRRMQERGTGHHAAVEDGEGA